MAEFDESKVINALNADKAIMGKKYYFNDSLYDLMDYVKRGSTFIVGTLEKVVDGSEPFKKCGGTTWSYIYPYERDCK